jgi:hypothetical protein
MSTSPRCLRLLLAISLAGCSSGTEQGGGGGGGKADDPGAATCTFDEPSPLGDTSEDLAEHAVGNRRVSAADAGSLSELEAAQLVAAVVQLGMAEPGIAVADVFALSDDGEFDIVDIEKEGDEFLAADWIAFFAGDNEVGVVFADGTSEVIAQVSDGDLMHCEAPAAAVTCSFDEPSPLGDTSEDLAEHAVGNIRASAENADSLSALERAQLVAAVVHLGMAGEGAELADVFALSDDGEFDIVDIEKEGEEFLAADWIAFFAGDNEVGVVFADGTTEVIAEVSDGDLMHCE